MGRFDELLKAMGRVADPKIKEGDETTIPESPRNWLTGKINTVLPDQLQIPAQTVADEKRVLMDLPQAMAGSTMGGILKTGKGVTVQPTTQQLLEEAVTNANPKPMQANQVMNRFRELYGEEAAKRMAEVKKGQRPIAEYDSFKQEMLDKIRRGEK